MSKCLEIAFPTIGRSESKVVSRTKCRLERSWREQGRVDDGGLLLAMRVVTTPRQPPTRSATSRPLAAVLPLHQASFVFLRRHLLFEIRARDPTTHIATSIGLVFPLADLLTILTVSLVRDWAPGHNGILETSVLS